MKIGIVAQNRKQAQYLAHSKALSNAEWEYIYRPEQLRGTQGMMVWVYCAYSDIPHADDLVRLFAERQCKVVDMYCT